MTKELLDIKAPIPLYRLASLINVSKDSIVEFLSSRGYPISNKPTAMLTEDMLQLVLEKFRKDLIASERRREKLDKTSVRPPTKRKAREASAEKETAVAVSESTTAPTVVTTTPTPEPTPQEVSSEPEAPEVATAELSETDGIRADTTESAPTEAVVEEAETPESTPSVVPEAPTEESAVSSVAEPVTAEPATEAPSATEAPTLPSPPKEASTETAEEPTKATTSGERLREVISVTPEGAVRTANTGGLRVLGKIELPVEERRRGRRGEKAAKPEKPTRPSKQPPEAPTTAARGRRPEQVGKPQQRVAAREAAQPQPPVVSPPPVAPQEKPKMPVKRRRITIGEEAAVPKARRRRILEEISQEEISEAIRQTLAGLDEGITLRRFRQKRRAEREASRLQAQEEPQTPVLRVTEFLTTAELAQLLGVSPSDIIGKCLQLGLMVTINQRLDRDTISLIAADYGYEVEFQDVEEAEELVDEPDPPESLQPRPPIVTIMGHVDHGKTTLLDYIRQTNVVAGEAGGITQHIGAYQVKLPDGRLITFLDTPGHEAFTAMRARGAQVTDIVVLVVAADDAVMPQTVEAINHARAANVPIIVAINKIDKPEANPDRIRQQLAEHGVLVEEWGGPHQCVEISALTGKNVDLLLEKILLEAELLDLRANPNRPARGTIIEAHLDKGKGPVATVIVQKGTLRIGDAFVAGLQYGRVRALYDERGNRVEAAPPSTPVQVAGFDGLPEVGDKLIVVEDERLARQIAQRRQQLKREQQARRLRQITLSDLSQRIQEGRSKELRIILKGDVVGSVEALTNALLRLSTDEVRVEIIHSGVGSITEADVMLAAASEAVIVGFQVQPTAAARKLAESEGVDIRTYRIIYECLDEIKRALEGLLSPEVKEEILGHAEVRQVFHISRIGTVAGCYVTDGVIQRNARVRVLRDGLPIHTGTLSSLKRFKEDVREVSAGYECGLTVSDFEDFQEGDIIEAFRLVEQKRTLDV